MRCRAWGRLAALVVLTAGCASMPIAREDATRLLAADARVEVGCYDCLLEARTVYAALAVGRARAVLLPRLFEIDLLLALREKELALDADATLRRAGQLAVELPPALEATRYLEIVTHIGYDRAGWPRHAQPLSRGIERGRDLFRARDEDAAFLATDGLRSLVRQYLSLSLDCERPRADVPAGAVWPDVSEQSAPILQYRASLCGRVDREVLEQQRRAEPAFVETTLFLARDKLRARAVSAGQALARAAYARFPDSPAVTFLRATLYQLAADCRSALGQYAETLALADRHEDALLGRTVCQTRLGESEAAMATATVLIDMQAYNYGDAYYWRAWNRHARGELALARADSDRAKTLRYNTTVLTLAGMIEYGQADLGVAEEDLATARRLDASNCTAAWYGALVALKRELWPATADRFVGALDCYAASVRDNEARRLAVDRDPDLEPAFKATQLAGFDAAIREDRSQESASAFNAAVNFLRAGDVARAEEYTEKAALDPDRAEIVADMRERLLAVQR